MFGFLADMGNYEKRKVARYEDGEILISTARCSDGTKPYETAIMHPDYNNGEFIIVQAYDTKEEAAKAHDAWVNLVKFNSLPDPLVDCGNSQIAQFATSLCKDWQTSFPRKKPLA